MCDYEDIDYPIPFQQLITKRENHYVSIATNNSILPSFILTTEIPRFTNHSSDMLLITGSDDQYFYNAINTLYEIVLADPYASILFVDCGLSSSHMKDLSFHFQTIHIIQSKMKSNGFLAYRQLNRSIYPNWMLKGIPALSIKSIILEDVFWEWQGVVGWIDSDYGIADKLSQALTIVRQYGIYSSCLDMNVSERSCDSIVRFLLDSHILTSKIIQANLCLGEVLFVDFQKKESHSFLSILTRCGYTEKCIASRECSDESGVALSLLLNEYRMPTRASMRLQKKQSVKSLVKQIQENYHVQL